MGNACVTHVCHLEPGALEIVVNLAHEGILDVGRGVVLPVDGGLGALASHCQLRSRLRVRGVIQRRSQLRVLDGGGAAAGAAAAGGAR